MDHNSDMNRQMPGIPGLGNDDDHHHHQQQQLPAPPPRRNPFGAPNPNIQHHHHHPIPPLQQPSMQQQQQQQQQQHFDNDKPGSNGNGEFGKTDVLVLPKALEDVFAFKDQLADQLGRTDGEMPAEATAHPAGQPTKQTGVISGEYDVDDADSDDDDANFQVPTAPLLSTGGDGGQPLAANADDAAAPAGDAVAPKVAARTTENKHKKKKLRKQLSKQRKAAEAAAAAAAKTVAATTSTTTTSVPVADADKPTDADSPTNGTAGSAENATATTDDDAAEATATGAADATKSAAAPTAAEDAADVTIEYVPDRITVADLAPQYRQFYRVFELFKHEDRAATAAKEAAAAAAAEESAQSRRDAAKQLLLDDDMLLDDDDDDDDMTGAEADRERLSKRKMKKLTRLSVAELKQLVQRPDVVEMHDVTARDPKLLVQLKAHRNTVQVPRHWCFKRKYLQGKRGIEKPPFDLPAFIKKTGIMEMRASLQEKDEAKTLKAKMRERARPKMGKIDIDYQKLHDAFFKWQTKPRMTIHGDLYYEGKEFETRLKEKKPGDLSEELRTSLGMPIGVNCHKIPPPWLIAQQRYGPPPSYPNLKIPGLNAPIPDGTSFGYHAGGWGKPPVDEKGKPLYGDVFGTNYLDPDGLGLEEADVERAVWGELESESEEESEEEDDEEAGEGGEDLGEGEVDESGLVTPAEGLVTPSGMASGVPLGLETPDTIELRKKKIENEMEDNETPVLYQVLPEKRGDRIGAAMMGSTHVYDMSSAKAPPPPNISTVGSRTGTTQAEREGMVELALDPSELDMDGDAMAQRYEQQMREQQSHLQKEDLSDMLAEHVARQKSKRKRQQGSGAPGAPGGGAAGGSEATASKQQKKYKEFKF